MPKTIGYTIYTIVIVPTAKFSVSYTTTILERSKMTRITLSLMPSLELVVVLEISPLRINWSVEQGYSSCYTVFYSLFLKTCKVSHYTKKLNGDANVYQLCSTYIGHNFSVFFTHSFFNIMVFIDHYLYIFTGIIRVQKLDER